MAGSQSSLSSSFQMGHISLLAHITLTKTIHAGKLGISEAGRNQGGMPEAIAHQDFHKLALTTSAALSSVLIL